jgi:hypothetical protein
MSFVGLFVATKGGLVAAQGILKQWKRVVGRFFNPKWGFCASVSLMKLRMVYSHDWYSNFQMRNEPPVALSRAENEVSRRANLRLKLESRGYDPGAKAAWLRRISKRARPETAACACGLWRFRAKRALGLHTGSRQENASKQQISSGSDSTRTEKSFSKKRSQLVERVKNFQPHENERCDHQIIAKMHAGLATNAFRGPCESRARP